MYVQHSLLQIKTSILTHGAASLHFCLTFHLFFPYATLVKPSLALAVLTSDTHILLCTFQCLEKMSGSPFPFSSATLASTCFMNQLNFVVLLRLYSSLSCCPSCSSNLSPVSPHQSPQTLNRHLIFQQELLSETKHKYSTILHCL